MLQLNRMVLMGACVILPGCSEVPRDAAVDRETLLDADAVDPEFAIYLVMRAFWANVAV